MFRGVASEGETEALVAAMERERMECVIDLRSVTRPDAAGTLADLRLAVESREMYYAHLPDLANAHLFRRGQPERSLAWAARTALRHRTCLVSRGSAAETMAGKEIADLVGLRIIDLFP
jgi:hypothetical protein